MIGLEYPWLLWFLLGIVFFWLFWKNPTSEKSGHFLFSALPILAKAVKKTERRTRRQLYWRRWIQTLLFALIVLFFSVPWFAGTADQSVSAFFRFVFPVLDVSDISSDQNEEQNQKNRQNENQSKIQNQKLIEKFPKNPTQNQLDDLPKNRSQEPSSERIRVLLVDGTDSGLPNEFFGDGNISFGRSEFGRNEIAENQGNELFAADFIENALLDLTVSTSGNDRDLLQRLPQKKSENAFWSSENIFQVHRIMSSEFVKMSEERLNSFDVLILSDLSEPTVSEVKKIQAFLNYSSSNNMSDSSNSSNSLSNSSFGASKRKGLIVFLGRRTHPEGWNRSFFSSLFTNLMLDLSEPVRFLNSNEFDPPKKTQSTESQQAETQSTESQQAETQSTKPQSTERQSAENAERFINRQFEWNAQHPVFAPFLSLSESGLDSLPISVFYSVQISQDQNAQKQNTPKLTNPLQNGREQNRQKQADSPTVLLKTLQNSLPIMLEVSFSANRTEFLSDKESASVFFLVATAPDFELGRLPVWRGFVPWIRQLVFCSAIDVNSIDRENVSVQMTLNETKSKKTNVFSSPNEENQKKNVLKFSLQNILLLLIIPLFFCDFFSSFCFFHSENEQKNEKK